MCKIEEMSHEGEEDDESDKRIQARDRRYSCLTSDQNKVGSNSVSNIENNLLKMRSSSKVLHEG